MAKENRETGEKLIATNPSRGNYFVNEVVEAGIVLTGTEAKSMRATAPHLRDGFVEFQPLGKGWEAWLVNVHIGPYSHGNVWNHLALRRRKLLLHRHQLDKLHGAIIQKGMTVIPLRMYFRKGMAKIELGLAKGKKQHDKRDTLKKKAVEREMEVEAKSLGKIKR